MARKKKESIEPIAQEVKSSSKVYQIIKKLEGSINHKVYSFNEGEIVELSRLEAFAFSSYIKEQ